MLGKALHQSDLLKGEGGSARRDHIVHSRLVHADYVGVALHEVNLIGLTNCLLGLKETIKHLRLVVNL